MCGVTAGIAKKLVADAAKLCDEACEVVGELVDPSCSDVGQRCRRMGVDDRYARHSAAIRAARGDRPVVDDGCTHTESADQPDVPRVRRRFALGGTSGISALHSRQEIES